MAQMQTTSHDPYRFVFPPRERVVPKRPGSGCALHLDHLDIRLPAPIGLGEKWASHRSNEMMARPGTGRGGRRAAALIIT